MHLLTIDLDATSPAREADRLLGRLLETLEGANRKATFFVPKSRTASRGFVARIAEAGHELAALTAAATGTPYGKDILAELRTVRAALESATGQRVRGHRHLNGLNDTTEWVYDVLLDEGFEYDSSFLPIRDAQSTSPYQTRSVHAERRWSGTLLEVPTTTSELSPLPFHLGSVRSMRRVPLPVLRRAVKARDGHGEPSMLRLRESELRLLTNDDANRGSSAENQTLSRLGVMLEWAPFTTLGAALAQFLRSAPILER